MVQLNHDFEQWLYVPDGDWSDLIEISDVTRTVYISFVARLAVSSERLQPVVAMFSLLSFSDYPTITAVKFEGDQIALSLTARMSEIESESAVCCWVCFVRTEQCVCV